MNCLKEWGTDGKLVPSAVAPFVILSHNCLSQVATYDIPFIVKSFFFFANDSITPYAEYLLSENFITISSGSSQLLCKCDSLQIRQNSILIFFSTRFSCLSGWNSCELLKSWDKNKVWENKTWRNQGSREFLSS